MAVYTVSPDLLNNIEKDEGVYFTDILFVFTQRSNPFKVSKDRTNVVMESYAAIAGNNQIVKTWLDLMSFKPSPFELIDVDLTTIDCEETKFVKLCKETRAQNKLILYSRENIRKFKCVDGFLDYEGVAVKLLDRDEAKLELNVQNNSGDTYINSQVAKNNSSISDSEN